MKLVIPLLLDLFLVKPAKAFLTNIRNGRISLSLSVTNVISAKPLLPTKDSYSQKTNNNPLEIVYTTDLDTIESWIEEHASSTNILGIDTETIPRSTFLSYGREPFDEKAGPATLQLSTLDSCLLVHLTHAPQSLPVLQDLLEDSSIVKAGVGIDDDALGMYRSSREWEVKGRLDLGCVLKGSKPNQRMGLRALLANTAGLNMPKSKKVSMSNWGAETLTSAQVTYAGYDAWASAKIVSVLWENNLEGASSPLAHLVQDERPMSEVDTRARNRKDAKTKWKQLKEVVEADGGKWTKQQRAEQGRLRKIMKKMRADPPPMLNMKIGKKV